jgi:glycosyltransferase involved in cell wall biosynthesis
MVASVTPLVSIVIPFHDPGDFLHEAIGSILTQTVSDWELLLVDDASLDGSPEIARAYASLGDGRVRTLSAGRGSPVGMSSARNVGIQAATGEFVAFVDADDMWEREKLERQLATLSENPEAALVYGPTLWWYSWTRRGEDASRDFLQDINVETERLYPAGSLLETLLRRPHPTMTPALIRRAALETVGGFEPRFRGMFEDQVAFVKIAEREPVYVAADGWYRWRQHADSSCAVSEATGRYDHERSVFGEWLTDSLRASGPASRLAAVERALRPPKPVPPSPGARARAVAGRGTARLRAAARRSPIRLDRVDPVSRGWGYDRGLPVDRFYIERFLAKNGAAIRGHVVEVGGDEYTKRFGRGVTRSEILHVDDSNERATIIADLEAAPQLPSDAYDCIVITQTLQFVYDVRAVVETLHRVLRPGGVILATVPGISHLGGDEWRQAWSWRFTAASAARLFGDVFADGPVRVDAHGNLATSVAFLYGLAVEDLRSETFERDDADYDLLITIRAEKAQ